MFTELEVVNIIVITAISFKGVKIVTDNVDIFLEMS
jgi:hypothetical protein